MAAGGPPWGAGASVPHLVPLACCFSAQIVSGEVVVVVDEPMLMVRLGWLLGPLGIGSKVGVVGTVVMVDCGEARMVVRVGGFSAKSCCCHCGW